MDFHQTRIAVLGSDGGQFLINHQTQTLCWALNVTLVPSDSAVLKPVVDVSLLPPVEIKFIL